MRAREVSTKGHADSYESSASASLHSFCTLSGLKRGRHVIFFLFCCSFSLSSSVSIQLLLGSLNCVLVGDGEGVGNANRTPRTPVVSFRVRTLVRWPSTIRTKAGVPFGSWTPGFDRTCSVDRGDRILSFFMCRDRGLESAHESHPTFFPGGEGKRKFLSARSGSTSRSKA